MKDFESRLLDLEKRRVANASALKLKPPSLVIWGESADGPHGAEFAVWRRVDGTRCDGPVIVRNGAYAQAVKRGVIPTDELGYTPAERVEAERLIRTRYDDRMYGGRVEIPFDPPPDYKPSDPFDGPGGE